MNLMRFVIPKSMVEFVTEDSTVRQAIEKMRYHRYAAIPVIDREGKYVGAVRNDDVLSYVLNSDNFELADAEGDSVISIMDGGYVKPVYHNASMNELIDRVKEHNFVPVVDDRDCFVGIVLRRTIIDYLLKYYNENDRGNL